MSRLMSMDPDAIEPTLKELGVSASQVERLLALRNRMATLRRRLGGAGSSEWKREAEQWIAEAKSLMRSVLAKLADRLMEVAGEFSSWAVRDGRMAHYFPEIMMEAVQGFGLHRSPGSQSYLAQKVREQANSAEALRSLPDNLSRAVSMGGIVVAAVGAGALGTGFSVASVALGILGVSAAERARHIAALRVMAGTTDASAANVAEHNEDLAWLNLFLTVASSVGGVARKGLTKLVGAEDLSDALEILVDTFGQIRSFVRSEAIQQMAREGEAEKAWKRFLEAED